MTSNTLQGHSDRSRYLRDIGSFAMRMLDEMNGETIAIGKDHYSGKTQVEVVFLDGQDRCFDSETLPAGFETYATLISEIGTTVEAIDERYTCHRDIVIVSCCADGETHDTEALPLNFGEDVDSPRLALADWNSILSDYAQMPQYELQTRPAKSTALRLHIAFGDISQELTHEASLSASDLVDPSILDDFIDEVDLLEEVMIDIHADAAGLIRTATVSCLSYDPDTNQYLRSIRGTCRIASRNPA